MQVKSEKAAQIRALREKAALAGERATATARKRLAKRAAKRAVKR